MLKKGNSELITFLYRAGLFWFNVYMFTRTSSYAMGFARTWTSAYKPVASHGLILLYAVAFFVIFSSTLPRLTNDTVMFWLLRFFV